jgi:hypothetical protein
MKRVPGQVYLYHLTGIRPPWNHYIGYTTQPTVRHRHHREQRTQVSRNVAKVGGTMTLVVTRPGSLAVESALKEDPASWHLFCPLCVKYPKAFYAKQVTPRRKPGASIGPARERLSTSIGKPFRRSIRGGL